MNVLLSQLLGNLIIFELILIYACIQSYLDRMSSCRGFLLNMFRLVRFKENIVMDPGYVDIFPPLRIPNNLHHLAKPICRSSESFGSRSSRKEKGFRLMTDSDSLSSVLQYASDDEVSNSVSCMINSVSCIIIHRMCSQWLGVVEEWRGFRRFL